MPVRLAAGSDLVIQGMLIMIRRSIVLALVATQLLIGVPAELCAQALEQTAKALTDQTKAVHVNRTRPSVTPPPARPVFSATPSDLEILAARVLPEPIVPVG